MKKKQKSEVPEKTNLLETVSLIYLLTAPEVMDYIRGQVREETAVRRVALEVYTRAWCRLRLGKTSQDPGQWVLDLAKGACRRENHRNKDADHHKISS